MRKGQRTAVLLVLFAIAAAFAVRLVASQQQGLSPDEWLTANAIALDVPALIRDRLAGGHSPFYFLLLKALGLDGASPDIALRLPSLVFDSLAVGILVWTAIRLSGRWGGLAMLAFAAFTPALIAQGQIARPYAMLNLCLALALAGASALPCEPRRPGWAVAAVALGLIGAGYAHNVGLVAAILLPIIVCWVRGRGDPAFSRMWMTVTIIVWLALLPNVIALLPTLQTFAGAYWVETVNPFGLESLWRVVVATYGLAVPGRLFGHLETHFQFLVAGAIAGLALLTAFLHWPRAPIRTIALFAAALPLALVAISAVQSLLLARYFVSSLLAYLLLAAVGAALTRRRLGPLPILVVMAAVMAQGFSTMLTPRNPDWRGAAAFFDLTGFGIVRGVADTPIERGLLQRYAPAALDIDLRVEPDPRRAEAVLADQLRGEPFVWALLGWRETSGPDFSSLVACTWRFGQSRVVLLAKKRDDLPPAIRNCRAENGSLSAALQRLRPRAAP